MRGSGSAGVGEGSVTGESERGRVYETVDV